MRGVGIYVLGLLLSLAPGAAAWAQDHELAASAAFLRSVAGQYDSNSAAKSPFVYASLATGRAALPFANLQRTLWETVRGWQDVNAAHANHVDVEKALTELEGRLGRQGAPQDRYTIGTTRVEALGKAVNEFRGYSAKFDLSSTTEIADTLEQWSRVDPLRSDRLGRKAAGAPALDTVEAYKLQVDSVIAAVEAKVNQVDAHYGRQGTPTYKVDPSSRWAVYRDVVGQFQADERAAAQDQTIAKALIDVADRTAGLYRAEAYVDKLVNPNRTILSSAEGRTQAENERDFPAYYRNKAPAQLAQDHTAEINQETQFPH